MYEFSGLFLVFFVPLVGSFRISWKPAFLHALFLCEEFADAPEGGEGEGTENGVENDVFNEEKSYEKGNEASDKEYPPVAGAGVVFHLDDDGMKDSYDEKCGYANEESFEMERVQWKVGIINEE
jgi:hypothetical protein